MDRREFLKGAFSALLVPAAAKIWISDQELDVPPPKELVIAKEVVQAGGIVGIYSTFAYIASISELVEQVRADSTNYFQPGTPVVMVNCWHGDLKRGRYQFRGDVKALKQGNRMTIMQMWEVGRA